MNEIINGGIYSVDLHGSSDAEFIGEHPSIIIRSLKESDIYFIVPLTTYTQEKWDKVKQNGYGCKILSTGSIARIDKMKLCHIRDVKIRWISKNALLIITPDELECVVSKINSYVELSSSKCTNEYKKYHAQYSLLYDEFELMCSLMRLDGFKAIDLTFDDRKLICTFPKTLVSQLTIHDIKNIARKHFEYQNISFGLSVDKTNFLILISLVDKMSLTIKNLYDKLNAADGSESVNPNAILVTGAEGQ